MYSTCLFCHEALGTNELVEHFPVGRRLAFDASKGRLWVVCRKCERWNLTPLEERWEAIEECERIFSSTRLRVSTDNIGLARLREGGGLVLVRIGSALRPEMAAWRYGDQFGRRRTKHLVVTGASVAIVGGILILGPATGVIAGGGWGIWQAVNALQNIFEQRRVRLKLKLPEGDRVVILRKSHLDHTDLIRDEEGGWLLNLSYDPGKAWDVGRRGGDYRLLEVRGDAAVRVAGQILPKINASGARPGQVQEAVRLLERHGDPLSFFAHQARAMPANYRTPGRRGGNRGRRAAAIAKYPLEVRLALEMAAHEEQERRALEGELALLEAAWRDAEEVAQIADDMFLPEDAAARLEKLKREA